MNTSQFRRRIHELIFTLILGLIQWKQGVTMFPHGAATYGKQMPFYRDVQCSREVNMGETFRICLRRHLHACDRRKMGTKFDKSASTGRTIIIRRKEAIGRATTGQHRS